MKPNIIKITILILFITIAANIHLDILPSELEKKYFLPTSGYINIEELKVHYSDEGQGYPLVLIHGTSSSLHTWQGWTEKLKKHFRIIRMDVPAYGLTGPNRDHDYSEEWYDQFLVSFLNQLKIEKCHIAGNSRGGAIAWYFSAKHPERIKGLILVDAAGYPYRGDISLAFRLARTPVLNKIAKNITPRYLVKKSLGEVYYDKNKITENLVDRHFDLLLRRGNRNAFIARSINREPYSQKLIKSVKAPTLIMWGKADSWITPDRAELFKKDIPGSKVIIYPRAGHVPMEEIPMKTAGDALNFLKGLSQ